ncbi:macrophage mannose receptor 1-like [Engraulis encrasicolus]|uniref:macrophage mannose receptor 1-like n=1 Tax=Engraulis encrasicolus TaxID=184585 RepID=UPI002FD02704
MVVHFHVVLELKNWAEAHQYCREEFTELATIDNMDEMEEINRMIQDVQAGERIWIGLRQGRWQWSLADEGSSGENEAEFWNWDYHEPQGRAETNSAQPYVLVSPGKNWTEAQRYCREKHTDLASVRNQTENDKIHSDILSGLVANSYPWIGLFRDAWVWSDSSSSSFRYWARGEPNFGDSQNQYCARIKTSGLWNDEDCDSDANFICYEDKLVLVRENKTWMEAMQYCRQHHVDLVSVTSEKIQRWVEGWAKGASSPHVWLGLRYHRSFGFWFWVSGYSVCYDNFASDVDRMPGWDIAVAAVRKDGGQWVSFQETKQLNFICTDDEEFL